MGQAQATQQKETENGDTQGLIQAINRVQAIIEFDLDGMILNANENFLAATGYLLNEIKGQHHRIFCEEDFHTSLDYRLFWKALTNGEFQTGHYKRINKQGEPIWIIASYNPVYNADGKLIKIVKFATDVTEQSLKTAHIESKVAAINATQAVIEFDLDGIILNANDNFLSTLGYKLDEIQGKHHRIFCEKTYSSSTDYDNFWKNLREGGVDKGEYLRLAKDGSEVWINASYNPVKNPDGEVYRVVKFATDITESKNSTSVFEGKVNAISRALAVIEFELDGTIVTANEAFLDTVGYTLDQIVGKHHRIFCETGFRDSHEYSEFWKRLRQGEFNSGEFKRIAKDGSEIWINASYNPILDANGRPYRVVKFASDISKSKQESLDHKGKLEAIDRAQAVIEFLPDGTVLNANDLFLQTLGYSTDEIVGKHHSMFCDAEYVKTPAYTSMWNKLRSGEYDSGRFARVNKQGAVIWIQATYNPIFDLNGNVFKVVKIASDISAQIEVEQTVTRIVEEFSESTYLINEQASQVSTGAQTLGATTEEMNASVEELSASIDSIAENSREANNIAKNTQHEADLGSKAIERSIESMELINRSSEEISEIVKVISEIASQTNLLAFNAAIEAARAGEHGLGFSVVADEVRKLAERSSLATKEITKLINESVKRVVQGGEISKEAAAAFGKIVEGVSRTTFSVGEISTAAQEQQTAARDVSDAIQQISAATEDSAFASESIAQATKNLMNGAEELKSEAQKFSE